MNTYLISYDLIRPGKDYTRLIEYFRSFTYWAKPLESVWLIKSTLGAEQLRNAIQVHMDGNDKILVIDVTKRAAAWNNLPNDVGIWIKNNL